MDSYERRLDPLPERVETMIVSSGDTASWAVRKLIERTHEDVKVFGLDCEWDLVTQKGVPHKPDILQIATVHGFCAIFRLHLLKTIPPDLKGFLEDSYFAKVGVGVVEDVLKLKENFDVSADGVVDVRHLADSLDIPPKGLASLTNTVLGVNLNKYNYKFHQWTGRLSKIQTEYAALDAVYSARLFYKMSHDRLTQIYGDDWQNWSNREYHEKTLSLWRKFINKSFSFDRSAFYHKEVINSMLDFCDLTTIGIDEWGREILWRGIRGQASGLTDDGEVRPTQEEDQEPPVFQSKFLKKERKMKMKKEKVKRIPMRFIKKFIRRLEKQGKDPMLVPTEILPLKVLDANGKLDLNKINQLKM